MLDRLRGLYKWEPIKNCPGRYIVKKSADHVTPDELLAKIQTVESNIAKSTFQRENQDDVFVAIFLDEPGGGLITFIKKDKGSFVHTLNEKSGLVRKLNGLGYSKFLKENGIEET